MKYYLMCFIAAFRKITFNTALFSFLLIALFYSCNQASKTVETPAKELFVLDMVGKNPGELPFESTYNNPQKIKEYGYDGKVFDLSEAAQFGITWDSYDHEIFFEGTEERIWVENKQAELKQKYQNIKNNGLDVYCLMDMIVLPKTLVEKHKEEVCDISGNIDIHKPKTTAIIEHMIDEIFTTFPELSGLFIRTGETYLHDAPYHVGNNPISKAELSQIKLLNILRQKICIDNNKKFIYRTWDFGKFHSTKKYYSKVVNNVLPHENLYFSIKHTVVDFWRGTARNYNKAIIDTISNYWINEASEYGVIFNPTLGLGNHKQIVEVQCQREYEGKNAHPNYIAKGVIDGFPELDNTTDIICLRDFYKHNNFSGVWTWSRGGGWNGPYIKNEFWSDVNTYIIANWSKNPTKTEEELFNEFATMKGFTGTDIETLHKICLLSADGVFYSQYSQYNHVRIDLSRDDYIGQLDPYINTFTTIIEQGANVEDYLEEKKEGTQIWKQIDSLAQTLETADNETLQFIRTSCKYGSIKHEIMEKQWVICLLGIHGDKTGVYEKERIAQAIKEYDTLWAQWEELAKRPECPTLYHKEFRSRSKKLSVDKYRKIAHNF